MLSSWWWNSALLLVTLTGCGLLSVGRCAFAQEPRICAGRKYDGGIVCVCNSTYCDDLPGVSSVPPGTYAAYTSTQTGDRFVKHTGMFSKLSQDYTDSDATYVISGTGLMQEIIGFGGAFTDAAGIVTTSLSAPAQSNLLTSYFAPTGLQYSMGRVPMAGCDFSTHQYSYDEFAGDFGLSNFSLTKEDLQFKIPLIQQAQALAGATPLNIFASPWSAPGWMKTNNKMAGMGQLKGQAGDAYHKTWALYFVKFVQAYQAQKVSIWGLTAQNEPIDGFVPKFPFQAMGFTAASQRDFIAKDLGPALEAAGLRRVKLMILDDQRFLLPAWADTVLASAEAAKYIDGIGVHWYLDSVTPASKLTKTHQRHPDKFILSTEACQGSSPGQKKVILGSWDRAESYAHDIIENLQNWVGGWIDWNLALNTDGGPNWANNFVDSPIIVNASSDEFYKQPMFYALSHFSKLMPPHSTIIKGQWATSPFTGHKVSSKQNAKLEIIAAVRPDAALTAVVLNKSSQNVTLKIVDGRLKRGQIVEVLPAHSIVSFVWW